MIITGVHRTINDICLNMVKRKCSGGHYYTPSVEGVRVIDIVSLFALLATRTDNHRVVQKKLRTVILHSKTECRDWRSTSTKGNKKICIWMSCFFLRVQGDHVHQSPGVFIS